ncbi:MAG: ABC transporter ATP-binding protein [Rhizobacter sp.]|nr:ABC transporter ATP-binding protein [Chlorobiales bacterium]
MTAVTLEHIHKSYGDRAVLGDLSLTIEAGEFFVLLGQSGCGKTTLLKIIAGLIEPERGTVKFDDEVVAHRPPETRGSVYLFQEALLFPFLTVEENIAFGLKMRGVSKSEQRERASSALIQIGLKGFEKRRPSELSGGQQQRVSLARALVLQPKVLLLDEPLSGLDAALRDEMRRLLLALHAELKMTTVMVTHDQMEAAVMGRQIGVMIGGQLEQVGTPHEIFQHPETPAVARFIGQSLYTDFQKAISEPEARLRKIE